MIEEALGPQTITVTGVPGSSHFARTHGGGGLPHEANGDELRAGARSTACRAFCR